MLVILEATTSQWRSTVYDHYKITLHCNLTSEGLPKLIDLVYECKFGFADHKPLTQHRKKTAEGTSNLKKAADACTATSGQSQSSVSTSTTPNIPRLQYTYATHRVLIALRCAKNFRPFNMVSDSDYIMEVILLCPGTQTPDPSVISRNIKHIYECMSIHVKDYFLVSFIYMIIDLYWYTTNAEHCQWTCSSSSGWLDLTTHFFISWAGNYMVCWWSDT